MADDRVYDKPEVVREVTKRAIEVVLKNRPTNYVARTLLVLVHSMLAHNRLADNVSRGYIARTADISERQVTRALRVLVDLDVVMWFPGASPPGGQRRPGRVVFIRPDRGVSDQGSEVPPGRLSTHDRGVSVPRPGSETSPSQVLSRKNLQRRDGASAGAPGACADESEIAALKRTLLAACKASNPSGVRADEHEADEVMRYVARTATSDDVAWLVELAQNVLSKPAQCYGDEDVDDDYENHKPYPANVILDGNLIRCQAGCEMDVPEWLANGGTRPRDLIEAAFGYGHPYARKADKDPEAHYLVGNGRLPDGRAA